MGKGFRREGGTEILGRFAEKKRATSDGRGAELSDADTPSLTISERLAKYVALVSAVAFAVAIFDYARLGAFTRFMADDFCGAADVRQMGILGSVKDTYLTWDGRFSSNLLNAFFQNAEVKWAAILPTLVMIAWLVALWLAAHELSMVMGWSAKRLATLTGVLLVAYATLESAPSLDQSFFWETGVLVYGVPLALMMAYIAVVLRAIRRDSRLLLVSSAVITFFADGFSETYAATQVAGFILCWGLWRWLEKDRRARVLLPGIAASLASFVIMAAAPGNLERHKTFILYKPDYWGQLCGSLLWTFYQVYRFVWQHPMTAALCLLLPMLAAVLFRFSHAAESWSAQGVVRLLWWNAGVFLVVMASVVPAFFATGAHPPDRAMATTQLVIVCWVCWWGYTLGMAFSEADRKWLATIMCAAVVVLAVFGPGLTATRSWRAAGVYKAYADMWDTQDNMIKAAKARGERSIVLRSLPHWGGPGMESPGADPTVGFNLCIARYYGMDSVSYRDVP